MKCTFVVGQRVQCIVKVPWDMEKQFPTHVYPRYGMVLTISEMLVLPDRQGLSDVFLRFKEIILQYMEQGAVHESLFHWIWFRPLNERPTSIEIFQKLTRPNPNKVKQKDLENV